MPCYFPLPAFKTSLFTKSGSSLVKVLPRGSTPPSSVESFFVSCGSCIGCRLERSRQWAVRCVHESSLYNYNSFVTLTFSDDYLYKRDNPLSVSVRDLQLFMKRLRKRFSGFDYISLNGDLVNPIRFFACGEYGDVYRRPHYHICLFNFDFLDKVHFKNSNGIPLYVSRSLSELWPFGFSTLGSLTFESAAYTARYVMKKYVGDDSSSHYSYEYDNNTFQRVPEFVTMSRKPGIGFHWFNKFNRDVYVSAGDSVVMRGVKFRPPKYYDRLYEDVDFSHLEKLKSLRSDFSLQNESENQPHRLHARYKVKLASISSLYRNLE